MIITVIAVIQDMRNFKISNKLSIAGIAAAVCFMIAEYCMGGDVTEELAGGIGVFGVLYIVYMIGGVGAGDVKLLTVIGLLLGKCIILITAAAFAAAALWGIAGMLFNTIPKRSVRLLEGYYRSLHVVHFSVAILVGEVIVLYMMFMMY